MAKLKLIVGSVAVLVALYFGHQAYSYIKGMVGENSRLHTELIGQQDKYKQLSAYTAKLEIDYVSQQDLQKQLQSKFAAEKDELTGRLKVLSNATFLIREQARKGGASDVVYQGDGVKYVLNEIRFTDGPPIGYVLIFDDGRVVSRQYNYAVSVNTAISRDESTGKYSILSRADYVLKSPSLNVGGQQVWTNKPYPLKIVGGVAMVDPTEQNQLAPRWQVWAPHINGGMSAGAGAAGAFLRPTVDLSLSGFGRTKNDLDWKFIHLGLDTDTSFKDFGMHVFPFSYRFWPGVFSNTYLAPGLGWSLSGVNAQLNLNLTF